MNSNQEQIDYWNGEGGERWVRQDQSIDALIRPLGAATLAAAAARPGESVLDIGCGCGHQAIELARCVGAEGRVLGVDVSAHMLAAARRNASDDGGIAPGALQFLQADAAAHPFPPAAFDLLFSRFGVMFFADPGAAFAHLRAALRPDGRLVFCCWQALKHNDMMLLPLSAALAHLPPPESMPADAPGPFAFADAERVRHILAAAGFNDVRIDPLEIDLHYGAGLELQEIARRLLELGPAARMLAQAHADTRQLIERELCERLAARHEVGGVRLPARCWLVQARG